MIFSCKELKRQARETLNGRYGLPMGTSVVTGLIILTASFPFESVYRQNPGMLQGIIYVLASLIISLLSIVLTCGTIKIHLGLARGKQVKFLDLFTYFSKRPDRLILAQLLLSLITFAASIPMIACMVLYYYYHSLPFLLLCVVVDIADILIICYLSLSYGLIYFLLVDNEEMRITDAFRESFKYMQGNRFRLFYIQISFIGMVLLCLLSFGIGYLWVAPYMLQTNTAFYRNTIGEVS